MSRCGRPANLWGHVSMPSSATAPQPKPSPKPAEALNSAPRQSVQDQMAIGGGNAPPPKPEPTPVETQSSDSKAAKSWAVAVKDLQRFALSLPVLAFLIVLFPGDPTLTASLLITAPPLSTWSFPTRSECRATSRPITCGQLTCSRDAADGGDQVALSEVRP